MSQISVALSSVRIQLEAGFHFEPPHDTHFIGEIHNIGDLRKCAVECHQHAFCRTADYNAASKICRLYESLTSAGTLIHDGSTVVLSLNYCIDNEQTEPEFVCLRSGTYSVQNLFDRLGAISPVTLQHTDRGLYVSNYGIYTSSSTGFLSFFSPALIYSAQPRSTIEITNINPITRTGLVIVRYNNSEVVIYTNNGTEESPSLYETRVISLPAKPYSCYATETNLYVTFLNSYISVQVYSIQNGSLLHQGSNLGSISYRPVITRWKNSYFVLDEYKVREYDSKANFQRSWTYISVAQSGVRHYFDHDYAGRRFTCNSAGTHPGVYALRQNFTIMGSSNVTCKRAIQFSISKDRIIYTYSPSDYNSTVKIIYL